MTDDLQRIRSFLSRLIWRERTVVALDIAGRALLVVFVALLWVVLAAALQVDRGGASAALVFVGGVGVWAAVIVPFVLRWRPAGDALRQARLAEAEAPELRGRLVTLVEHLQRAPGQRGDPAQEGDALLGLVARRAAAALPVGRVGRIHRAARQVALIAAAAVLVLLPLPLSWFAGGPVGVVRFWASGFDANAALAALDLGGDEDRVQVGDLVLRYVYPDYTGLDPRVVENSTGDAAGPPGTTVEFAARSAESVEAAGLVAYDQRYEAAVKDGRVVTGSFLIGPADGTYHVVTWIGEASRRSRDFQIVAEEDLAPEVMLDGPEDTVELAVDEPMPFSWRARDDFGVASVRMQIDGKVVGRVLFTATERKAEAVGEEVFTPAGLGLAPGDEVTFELGATDNDSFSGAKVGVSRPVRLIVLGPNGLRDRSAKRLTEISAAMLTVLADHLEEAWPVGAIGGDYARWGQTVSKRYEVLQGIVDRDWDALAEAERSVLAAAVESGGALVRHTQVVWEPNSTSPVRAEDVAETGVLRDKAILALEDGILSIDRQLRSAALDRAVDLAQRMEDLSRQLSDMMERGADAMEMFAQLERMEQLMSELAAAAARLDEGGVKEFLNARSDEARDLMEEIRQALSEGRTEDARKLMERLARQIQQMSQGLKQALEQQQMQADEQMDAAKALVEEMQALEQSQRDLQEEVQELREKEDAQAAAKAEKLWEELQREAGGMAEDLSTYREDLEDASRDFFETQRTEATQLVADRLIDASVGRDFRGAVGAALALRSGLEGMSRASLGAHRGRRDLEGPGPEEIDDLFRRLITIEALLAQLDMASSSEATREKTEALQQKQQQLEQKLEQLQQQGQEVAQNFPVRPGEMQERLDESGERMEEAGDDLGQGRPMQAEGGQGAAADRLREAREALEKAIQQAQQERQGGEGEGEGPGDDQGGGRDQKPPSDFELPTAEDFRTPEEYRRALLEGMEGEVPEEFQALKKRYFEELVRQ